MYRRAVVSCTGSRNLAATTKAQESAVSRLPCPGCRTHTTHSMFNPSPSSFELAETQLARCVVMICLALFGEQLQSVAASLELGAGQVRRGHCCELYVRVEASVTMTKGHSARSAGKTLGPISRTRPARSPP